MINYGKVFSSTMPPHVKVATKRVFVATNIKPVETEEMSGYEYDYVAYTKEEYIHLLSEQNDQLNAELLDTQEALCDLYEMIAGGTV